MRKLFCFDPDALAAMLFMSYSSADAGWGLSAPMTQNLGWVRNGDARMDGF